MLHGAVVPYPNCVRFPPHAGLKLDALLNVAKEELKDRDRLPDCEPFNMRGKCLVCEDGLPASDRVRADKRVSSDIRAQRVLLFAKEEESQVSSCIRLRRSIYLLGVQRASIDGHFATEHLLHHWR